MSNPGGPPHASEGMEALVNMKESCARELLLTHQLMALMLREPFDCQGTELLRRLLCRTPYPIERLRRVAQEL